MEALDLERLPVHRGGHFNPAIFNLRSTRLRSEQHNRLRPNCRHLESRPQGVCKRALIGIIVIARKDGYGCVRVDLRNVQKAVEDRGRGPSIARLHDSMAEAVVKVPQVVILVCLG